jgi:hypothetical protein
MTKFQIVFLALTLSFSAFAEPVVYVCERPAWEGVKSCGPNNTYYTYAFHVDTDDLVLNKDDPKYDRPTYAFQMRKGCDVSKGGKFGYYYSVTNESLTFWINLAPTGRLYSGIFSRVKLNRENLTAVMDGVKKSPFLTCRMEISESWIITQAKASRGTKAGELPYNRTFPTKD